MPSERQEPERQEQHERSGSGTPGRIESSEKPPLPPEPDFARIFFFGGNPFFRATGLRSLVVPLILLLPAILAAEPPSVKDLESEIFKHATLPCVMMATVLSIKKDKTDPKDGMESVKRRLDQTAATIHKQLIAALSPINLRSKTRHQRMVLYQFTIAAFLAGSLGVPIRRSYFGSHCLLARRRLHFWPCSGRMGV